MNNSTNTTQTHDTTTSPARTTAIGFRRPTMAGSLLIMAITATAVSLAATSHADPDASTPDIGITATAPAPAAPWFPTFDRFGGHWHPYCSLHWDWKWHCDGI